MKNSNLIITGARIVTPLGRTARKGKDMDELFDGYGSIEITEGKITYVGPDRPHLPEGYRSRAGFAGAAPFPGIPVVALRPAVSGSFVGALPERAPSFRNQES